MALVRRDAGVDWRCDEQTGLGWGDEKRLGSWTPFGLLAIVVLLSLGAIVLGRKINLRGDFIHKNM